MLRVWSLALSRPRIGINRRRQPVLIKNMKLLAANRIVVAILASTLAATSVFGAGNTQAQLDHTAWRLNCVDLARMHLEYLLLDEVIAGKGTAVDADIDRAVAHLNYLLLPEVAADGSCRSAPAHS
jgi:hypothetical protein